MSVSIEESPGGGARLAGRIRALVTGTDTASVAQRSAAIALVIRLSNAALAYLAQVVLARLMGQHEYGVFAYTWVWFLVFGAIGTFGFGDSPVRYIAQLRARGEDAHLRGFIRFSTVMILVSSIAFGALVIAALPFAGVWIENVYLMPMALMAISIPFACLQSLLEAFGRSYNWTISALLPPYILRHGLLLLFTVAAVAIGMQATALTGYICLIVTMVVSTAYQATAIIVRMRKTIEPGPRAYRPREWVRGSAPFAVLYAGQHLAGFADVLVLSFFAAPAEIAIYFAATRIIQVVNLVPYAATVGTAHLFSASHTRGDHDHLQQLCRHVVATTFVIAILAVGILIAGGDWLLKMFGEGFEAGYSPLVILAIGVVMRVAAGPAEDVLNMTGHSGLSASTYLVIVAVNVAFSVPLIMLFGVNGAATAGAIALTLRALWLAFAAHRRLHVNTSILAVLPRAGFLRAHPSSTPAE
ncbi:MAG: polysaccharide biosynthesis C-terminal domain-containing protein [Propylenella sp.]